MLYRLMRRGIDERVHGLRSRLDDLRAWLLNLQTGRRAFQVGEQHYDLGNDLFEAMLGKRLVYSCGYWPEASSLDDAQEIGRASGRERGCQYVSSSVVRAS